MKKRNALPLVLTALVAALAIAQTAKPNKDLIGQEDVYKIRIFEQADNDVPTVEFKNDVVDRFIRSQRGSGDFEEVNFEKKFRGWPRSRQVKYILEYAEDDKDILQDILIKNDPKVIREFQSSIWPMVSQNCGQIKCHGAAKGKGGFALLRGSGEKNLYTNFLILSLWEKDGQRMIDRGDNENSLLLQYGLPAKVAKMRHPDHDTNLFASMKAGNYRKVEAWVSRLKGARQPDYGTTYQPPVGLKLSSGGSTLTTQTTSGPASGPATDAADQEENDNPFDK